jgi:formate-dependent nitrite reductase membrane component NrfD
MSNPNRVPDFASESRLAEIRRKASQAEPLAKGVVPMGSPFPPPPPENGYYGIPLLKEPQWMQEIPLYFFVGGAAGASAVIASAAQVMGQDRDLVHSARWVAALGGMLSAPLLVSDLGMPSRFLNMLRVFKLQSPMSVGAWTLTAFSSFSAAAAFANLMRTKLGDNKPVVVLENASGVLAAATGMVMSSYTGVLVGATVIPVWNKHVGSLPMHFTASGLNSAVSILELIGHDNQALNLLGLAASAYEVTEGTLIESNHDRVNRPLQKGKSGWIVRAGGLLSGPVPFLLRLAYAITGKKKLRQTAAVCSIAGSLLTRFGWVEAGKASARDYAVPLELDKATG